MALNCPDVLGGKAALIHSNIAKHERIISACLQSRTPNHNNVFQLSSSLTLTAILEEEGEQSDDEVEACFWMLTRVEQRPHCFIRSSHVNTAQHNFWPNAIFVIIAILAVLEYSIVFHSFLTLTLSFVNVRNLKACQVR